MVLKNPANETNEFSRLISSYIESSGYSVYKISQITGLGRTAIHQVMSGKLTPTRTFFEQLCTVLQITPKQKNELTELYLKEKIGTKLYYEQKNLISIIEKLPQYYIDYESSFDCHSNISMEYKTFISGLLNINRIIIDIIDKETKRPSPEIYTTIPFDNATLFDLIIQYLAKGKSNIIFEHYIRMYKSSENSLRHNMDILEKLLKMSINSSVVYKPYSYYIHEDAVDDVLPIYPYSLVTSEYVVMIASDFKTAVIINDVNIICSAREHINKLKAISSPMIEIIDKSRMYDIFFESTRLYFKSVEFQPCLTKYLTFDIIKERLLSIPGREDLIDSIEKSFFTEEELKKTFSQKAICYYSLKGLKNFTQTGLMLNMPGNLLNALSITERLFVLNEFKKDIGKDYKMIDTNKLNIPEFIQVILLKNQKCLISCLMKEKNFCCILSEQSLFSAFYEFINDLEDRCFVLNDDEAKESLDKCICYLEELRNQ